MNKTWRQCSPRQMKLCAVAAGITCYSVNDAVCLLYSRLSYNDNNHCAEIHLTLNCYLNSLGILFLRFKRLVWNTSENILYINAPHSGFEVLAGVSPKGLGERLRVMVRLGLKSAAGMKSWCKQLPAWCLSCVCVWVLVHCLKQTRLHGDRGFLSARFPFTLITH